MTLIHRTALAWNRLYAAVHNHFAGSAALILAAVMTSSARGAGSNMPWEAPLQSILASVQGPDPLTRQRPRGSPRRYASFQVRIRAR